MMLSSMRIAVDALGLYITRINSLQYHKAQAQCTKIGSNLGFAVRSCRDMESWLTEGMLALSYTVPSLVMMLPAPRAYLVQSQPSET